MVHLIIVDEWLPTLRFVQNLHSSIITWRWHARRGPNLSTFGHIATLRNFGVQESRTRWISFLDDDNELESNHIGTLVDCARRTGCRAVHSYMRIFNRDGTPYLEPRHPWTRDYGEGLRRYAELCVKGVFQPGSNVVRDRVDPPDHPDPVRTVDMGEWLLERSLLLDFPLSTEYDLEDWKLMRTDDDKLLDFLIANRIQVARTELPTYKYYLGGLSNDFSMRSTLE
jgi:hypothetical protein